MAQLPFADYYLPQVLSFFLSRMGAAKIPPKKLFTRFWISREDYLALFAPVVCTLAHLTRYVE